MKDHNFLWVRLGEPCARYADRDMCIAKLRHILYSVLYTLCCTEGWRKCFDLVTQDVFMSLFQPVWVREGLGGAKTGISCS